MATLIPRTQSRICSKFYAQCIWPLLSQLPLLAQLPRLSQLPLLLHMDMPSQLQLVLPSIALLPVTDACAIAPPCLDAFALVLVLLYRRVRVRVPMSSTHELHSITKPKRPQARTHATPRGFELLRAEPNGFLVHLLNHSDTVSCCLVRISHFGKMLGSIAAFWQ